MPECKSCGAPIRWMLSVRNEKPIPINVEPTPNGNLVIEQRVDQYVARAATAEDRRLARPLYTSHFATCPDAASWRGGGSS